MSAQEELDRLTGCLALATGLPFQGRLLGGAVVARSCTDEADACVVTTAAATEAEAVAAFRAILRADTEAAVAGALAAERAKAAAAPHGVAMTPEDVATVAALAKGEALKKFLRVSPLTADDARRFWGHPRGGRVTRAELDALAALLTLATNAAAEPSPPAGLCSLSTCYALLNLHRLLRGRFEGEVASA